MALKIYKKNNYCIIEEGTEKRYFAAGELSLCSKGGNWVLVNSSQKSESFSFNFADLQNELGVSVGTAELVEDYLTLNTNFNLGAQISSPGAVEIGGGFGGVALP